MTLFFRNIFLSLATVLIVSHAFAQGYRGKVFVDINNNGKQETGEKALPGISVTDGLHVVKTDATGTFTLPGHEKARFIYLSMPGGYKTNKFYQRINENISRYNFGLHPYQYDNSKGFSFIQITDTETSEYGVWIDNLKNYIRNNHPAFLMHTGDICYEPGLRFHAKTINDSTMGSPVHYSIGNHDLVKGSYGEQLYESLFGPVFYSFDVANIHFLVLPMLYGDYKPSYTKEDVYRWMKNDLAATSNKKSIIVLSHDLLSNVNNQLLNAQGRFIYGISDTAQIDLGKHKLKAWIYGHWHDDFIKSYGKTPIISVCSSPPDKGGIIHSISYFRVFHINKDGKLSIETRYTYLNRQAAIAAPTRHQMVNSKGTIPISVNAYNTASPVQTVAYKIKNKDADWKSLTQKTSWNWRGHYQFPDSSFGKKIHIEVRIILKNGSEFYRQKFFTVSKYKPVRIDESWPELLKDNNLTGTTNGYLALPMQLIWTANAGGPIYLTAPIVADNKVFIATKDEGNLDECFITGFNAQNGERLWQYKTDNSIKGPIAYKNGRVIAADVEGQVYCVDALNGELLWEKDLQLHGIPSYVPGVLINDSVVYAGEGASLSALALNNGKIIWKGGGWERSNGTTSPFTLAGNVLVSSSQWNSLNGNDIHTGKLLWAQAEEGLRFRSSPTVYKEGKLFTCSTNKIFRLDPQTGKIERSIQTPYNLEVTSRPLIMKDKIIVSTADAGIAAFDRKTGKELWQFSTGPALVYTSPYTRKQARTVEPSLVLKGSTLLFGASDGWCYAVNANTGQCRWKTNLGSPVFAPVAISGDFIFVTDYGGNVYAFKSSK